MLYIYEDLRNKLKNKYKEREINAYIGRAYHYNRYINVSTNPKIDNVHYEYLNGHLALHLEGGKADTEFTKLVNYLHDKLSEDKLDDGKQYEWRKWQQRDKGQYFCKRKIMNSAELIEELDKLMEIVDNFLASYFANSDNKTQNILSLSKKIISISELEFGDFTIPDYQRPYKWQAKHVNALISDILAFKDCEQYRLGSLIIHNDGVTLNIVDGQQRLITLSLLLYALGERASSDKISTFLENSFSNPISIANIASNYKVIKDRINEFSNDAINFLLNKCELVQIVTNDDISVAFQFFDSQNARGKDLEAHDLLKAYHLRDMPEWSKTDKDNIEYWESLKTDDLTMLFTSLFRIKQWQKGIGTLYFTKDNVNVFKGISLNSDYLPCYMKDIICHYFANRYETSIERKIDNSALTYPYQIESSITNGSRFFDMVRHYKTQYDKVRNTETFTGYSETARIIEILNTYNNRNRTGDRYVRMLFDMTLMYYIDKFGYSELDRVVKMIVQWAYSIRFNQKAVRIESIRNLATSGTSMLRAISSTISYNDVLNQTIPTIIEANYNKELHNKLFKASEGDKHE